MYREDELIHYGVLGMRWGQRKARTMGTDYKYTSLNTQRHQAAANKLTAKAKKAKTGSRKQIRLKKKAKIRQKKALASQKYDDLQSDYAKNKAKIGSTVLASLIATPAVRNSYQRMRATGGSVVGSAALAFIFNDISGRVNKHKYIKKHSK